MWFDRREATDIISGFPETPKTGNPFEIWKRASESASRRYGAKPRRRGPRLGSVGRWRAGERAWPPRQENAPAALLWAAASTASDRPRLSASRARPPPVSA